MKPLSRKPQNARSSAYAFSKNLRFTKQINFDAPTYRGGIRL